MFKSSTVCVITGASRGIGRAIAETFAKEVSKHKEAKTSFILTARSQDGLQETREIVTAVCPSDNLDVHCVVGDLSNLDSLEGLTREILDKVNTENFSTAVLINNCAALNDVSKMIIDQTLPVIRSYWDLNLSSFLHLTSCFVAKFKSTCKVFVVNISSHAGVIPLPSLSLYCIGKAARHMAMRVLAAEYPEVRTLSYAPGVVDTVIMREVANNSGDQQLKQVFSDMINEGTTVKPEDASSVLLGLLLEDSYENGAHVTAYDQSKPSESGETGGLRPPKKIQELFSEKA